MVQYNKSYNIIYIIIIANNMIKYIGKFGIFLGEFFTYPSLKKKKTKKKVIMCVKPENHTTETIKHHKQ